MFFNHEDQVQWELKLMQLNKEKNEVETKYEEKKKEIYFNSFEWRFEFPEVLDDNGYFIGFDVIIGNPPYIEIRDVKEHFKNFYNFIYPEQKNSFDLYSLFIQRSLSLLKANSQLAFIVPRPILYNSTFKPIRKLIFENSLNQIYLPEKLVFEKAFVETVILFISKNKKEGKTLLIRSANKEIISNISDGNFAGSPIIIGDSYVTNIINKLNKNKKLSDFVDIIRGLELGKNTIKHQTEENDKNVKIFAGEAIQKYTFFEDKTILVKKHDLESFLKNTNKKFLQYPRIVLRRVAQEPIVTILAQGEDFLNNLNSVYNLAVTNTKISNEFLVGVLNSNLIKFYIQKSFSSDEKLFPYLRIEQLKEIPIVLASDKQQEPIIKLVKQIYELKKQNQNVNILELETKIDEFVFKLYDLSNEEVINIKKEI
jgi:hypothetical protein